MISIPSDLVTLPEAFEALKDEIPRLTYAKLRGWANRGKLQKYGHGVGREALYSLAEIREKAAIRPIPVDDTQS